MEPVMVWGDPHSDCAWRRWCGSALLVLGPTVGCNDGPVEAPLAIAESARPIHEAVAFTPCEHAEAVLKLIPLPAVDDAVDDESAEESGGLRELPAVEGASATASPGLLPPEPLTGERFSEWISEPSQERAEDQPPAVAPSSEAVDVDDSHTAEAKALLADASPSATGLPTGAVVTERAQAKIRRGYALARRGANFAARSEFVAVLRMIAEAKDQKHGARRRTIALASGLRALEEADDFAAKGSELDAEVSVAVIVSSHRTPVAKGDEAAPLMPQQLADLYFRYAQLQLGASVAGEPAGSMALHALGKLYSQLARAESGQHPQADRKAFALQQAALLARDDNHLAAHELGVLLAESGHYIESEHLLNQVAAKEPHPVVFRNLARVQRKLGNEQLAAASERLAQVIAHRDVADRNVLWVSPDTLARTGDAVAPATPPAGVAGTPPIPQPRPHAMPMAGPPVRNLTRLPGGFLR